MSGHDDGLPGDDGVLAGVLAAVREALAAGAGPDGPAPVPLAPGTRLDADLLMDSIELAALATGLQRRYGAAVDLRALVAGLDLDRIIELTVSDVAAHVAARCGTREPSPERDGPPPEASTTVSAGTGTT